MVKISNYTVVQAGKVVNGIKVKKPDISINKTPGSLNISPKSSIIEQTGKNVDIEEYEK